MSLLYAYAHIIQLGAPDDRAAVKPGPVNSPLAGRSGLGRRQSAVRGAKAQCKSQRTVPIGHLRAAIDIKKPNRFEEITGPGAQGLRYRSNGHRVCDNHRKIFFGYRVRTHRGSGPHRGGRSDKGIKVKF